MALTHNQMVDVIAAGGAVIYRGQVFKSEGEVPSDEQIASDAATDARPDRLAYTDESNIFTESQTIAAAGDVLRVSDADTPTEFWLVLNSAAGLTLTKRIIVTGDAPDVSGVYVQALDGFGIYATANAASAWAGFFTAAGAGSSALRAVALGDAGQALFLAAGVENAVPLAVAESDAPTSNPPSGQYWFWMNPTGHLMRRNSAGDDTDLG